MKRGLINHQFGTIIGTSLDFVEVHYGLGRPGYYLTQHQLHEYQKYTYGEWTQTFITLTLTKISICLFLMRIPITKSLIRPLQAAIVILVVSFLTLTLLWIFQCQPVSAAWSRDTIPDAKCFSRGMLLRIIISQAGKLFFLCSSTVRPLPTKHENQVISAVSDFAFAAFPILLLWRVQMPLKSKIGLCALMGLGVIVGACCIVRMVLNFQAIPLDLTYGGVDNWFWRLFEVQLGIIAACAPALRPGYKLVKRSMSSLIYSSTGGRRSFFTSSSGKQQEGKHVELSDQDENQKRSKYRGNRTTISRAPVSYGGSTELGVEDPVVLLSLPRNAILKKTRVDVGPDPLVSHRNSTTDDVGTFYEDRSGLERESPEVDVSPDFRRSVEMARNERLGLSGNMV